MVEKIQFRLSSEEIRRNSWCFSYTVYWKEQKYLNHINWKQKTFCQLKEARAFAKKMKKEHKASGLAPYIIQGIVPCNFFKRDLFNKLTIADTDRYGYDYARRIR